MHSLFQKEDFIISGIREKKKVLTHKKILTIAKNLFEEKGYKNVKTSEIAKLSKIGEGTLFNYFQSKSDLFIETFFQNFETVNDYKIDIEKINSEEQIIDEILNIINYYLINLKQIDKKLIREFYSIIYEVTNSESTITKKSQMNADIIIMNNLEFFFNYLIDFKIIDKNIDIEIAIKCIYGCSINMFNEFVYSDNMTYNSMMDNLKNQIKFILNGNIEKK